MRLLVTLIILACSVPGCKRPVSPPYTGLYEYSIKLLSGETLPLDQLRGKVLVLTNFSLGCGTTPQLLDLQELFVRYEKRGLSVIGFPSNDFVEKEINAKPHIKNRCLSEFGITFPLAAPIDARSHDLFNHLVKSGAPQMRGQIDFNMEKFVVDRRGQLRARYGPFSNPLGTEIVETVEKLLAEE